MEPLPMEDCNENDIGDVCECYANYEDESFIDGDDLNLLKSRYPWAHARGT
jgi:hypothetical protein